MRFQMRMFDFSVGLPIDCRDVMELFALSATMDFSMVWPLMAFVNGLQMSSLRFIILTSKEMLVPVGRGEGSKAEMCLMIKFVQALVLLFSFVPEINRRKMSGITV